jgi:centrosomal protein CEP76
MTGGAVGGAEFQLAIKRAVASGQTFKGFPQHFTHTDPQARVPPNAPHPRSPSRQAGALRWQEMMATLLRSETCLAIIQSRGQQARFAVRIRVFPYPDGMCSAWAMLAATYS